MSVTIYKPNAANKGSLFSFNFGPAKKGGDGKGDLALYISTVLQATWDAQRKTGSFKENSKDPKKTCNIKLTEFEVGGLMNSIQRRVEFKGYHTFPGSNSSTQFSFTPNEKEGVFNGFVFSILRGSDKAVFRIGIGPHECVTLYSFLDFGLKTLFSNRFRLQKFGGGATQEQAKPQVAKPAATAPVEDEGNPFGEEDAAPVVAAEEATTAAPVKEEDANENPFG